MKELMKSIETGLAAVEQCIEDAHYNITDANKIHEELTWAETMLQDALCDFAKLCNMIEVQEC